MPDNQATKSRRKSINKKLRFEVFKRDNFTCQYCGRKAPDVILQIDHLKPVKKGGKNDILNLVTSCIDCNQGKGAREIADNSIIQKKQKQAELLNERLQQIEMLRDWHIELANQENAEVEAVNSLYKSFTNNEYCISDKYKNTTIKKLIKKYGLSLVLEALSEGTKTYGDPDKALEKLPGICACKNNPLLNRYMHIFNKMRNHFSYFNASEAKELLKIGFNKYGENFYDYLDNTIYKLDGTWAQAKYIIYEVINSNDK